MINENLDNEYKGLTLFNDVADPELRARNRGVIMANIFEQNLDPVAKKVSPRGLSLIVGYFNSLVMFDRRKAKEAFEEVLIQRGIKHAS